MSGADTQFSKVRLEMLCDGIFAVAMVTIFIAPRQALFSAATTQIAIALATKRLAARR